MEQIVISGYYGFNNAGDEAILAALITTLKERIANVRITVLSANPSFTEKLHHVRAVNRLDLKTIISKLKEADLLISGGGSLLQDVTSNKTIPYYLGVIVVAKLIGVPVFFCAQGVGPITKKLNQKLVSLVLNRVDLLTVRDINSKNLLHKLGVKKEIKVTADPVFNLTAANSKQVKMILEQENIDFSLPTLAISVRAWDDNSYLDQLAIILNDLVAKEKVQLLMIPLKYPIDQQVSQDLQKKINKPVQMITGNYKPQVLIGIIANCDLMLGVRLHALIFAAVARIPVAGISYDQKVDSFLEQLGLKAITDIDNFNQHLAYQRLISLWNNKEEQSNKLKQHLNRLKTLAAYNFKLIEEKLGD